MTAYDRIRARAIDALDAHLVERGIPDDDAARVLDAVDDTSLAGFLGFLGSPRRPGDGTGHGILSEAARRVAETSEARNLGLDADDVETLLTAVFAHGSRPDAVPGDANARDVVLRMAVEQLAKQTGVPVSPEQAREAVRLLATGELFGDAASALGAAALAVRDLPAGLVRDAVRLPHRMVLLLAAIARDVAGTPFTAARVLEDLRSDGNLDHPPGVLRHTMARLLGFATIATTVRTLSELIRPENRSVRLALVVYARANGIPLEEADLDLLRRTVLDTSEPDLGPVLVAAVDRYVSRGDLDALVTVLRAVAATRGADG